MIPPRNFPNGILKLVEVEDEKIVKVHAELKASSHNREKVHRMRNDLLMVNPKLNLQVRENNA